jgi:redox-sensitive bicupin YhaK (pirin superfamily)
MIQVRPANERGYASHGWLESRHTFSFADYYDPAHMGFSLLRVINDDTVAPGAGFPTHGHRNMEIISYVLEGGLVHKDSMGNGSVIRPGEVQRMSAGTGVTHSEYNASDKESVRFLQIWIIPDHRGVEPSYEQKRFADDEVQGKLRLVASSDGRNGSILIHQDAAIYVSKLTRGNAVEHAIANGRKAWIQVARGNVKINGHALVQGDGAAITEESRITIRADNDTELLLFDLP